jgi:hypothetical protein
VATEQAAPPADGDVAAPEDASGDAPDAAADGNAGSGGEEEGTMPAGVQGAPQAFGLPDAYLPPWLQVRIARDLRATRATACARGAATRFLRHLACCSPLTRALRCVTQGAEGMPMPYPPFSPSYYVRYPSALRRKSASQCAHRSAFTADAAFSVPIDAQYPYMDVAKAYDAAAQAAQGGYVGAGAFALPPSPLLTPSMIGTLLPFSPMGSMSPLSPPGAMPLPPMYAMPDGSASYDPQAALAQYQAQQMMMTSPRAFGPAGPYALAPQMYDAYDSGDALPSPRQHMQARCFLARILAFFLDASNRDV